MRRIRFVSFAVVFLSIVSHSADAQAVPELYRFDRSRTAASVGGMAVTNSVEDVVIGLDSGLVTSNPVSLILQATDGTRWLATRTHSTQRGPSRVEWAGRLEPAPRIGRSKSQLESTSEKSSQGLVLLSYLDGRVSGVFHADGRHYQIVPAGSGFHRLVRVTQGDHSGCALHSVGDVGKPVFEGFEDSTIGGSRRGGGVTKIDVMGLYTVDFTATPELEQEAHDWIHLGVAQSNFVFAQGHVDTRYELVHVGPITALQPPLNLVGARAYLNNEVSSEEVGHLRNTHGADMVSLLIPANPDNPCGVANLPRLIGTQEIIVLTTEPLNTEPFDQQAFMVHELGCGAADWTFPHEHGHNLGMRHDRGDEAATMRHGDPVDPASFGHVFDVQPGPGESFVSTVMGCAGCFLIEDPTAQAECFDTRPPASVCDRVPHFSDPTVLYQGEPTGTPDGNPQVPPSNNARVARARSGIYSGFRPSSSNGAPTVTILEPADNSDPVQGTEVTFVGIASDPEDGDLSGTILWESNLLSEPLGTGSTVTHTFPSFGNHVITATVTDDAGQTVQHGIRVNVQFSPRPEIEVRVGVGGPMLQDGDEFVFPDTPVGELPISQVFQICNRGDGPLAIQNGSNMVSGEGFLQAGNPNSPLDRDECTTFSVGFDVPNAGGHAGAVSIESNDVDERFFDIALVAEAIDAEPDLQLVASYVPHLGATRTEHASSSPNPPTQVDFFYDPNLGSFEERQGGACADGPDNPTYFTIRIQKEPGTTITACNFHGSWDDNGPFDCQPGHVAIANDGTEVILNTDDFITDPTTCDLRFPMEPHVRFNEPHWFEVTLWVGGNPYTRRVNLRQRSQVSYLDPTDDTFIRQADADQTHGSLDFLRMRGGPEQLEHVFLRFNAFTAIGTFASSRLEVGVLGQAITDVGLYQVCGSSWQEGSLTWDNWETETGGNCGLLQLIPTLPAGKRVELDVGSHVNEPGVYSLGFATSDTGEDRALGSSERASSRPRLIITNQR
ncbi:MAG: DNRLRE domain-containing protein [Acidobacteriota bacterium]